MTQHDFTAFVAARAGLTQKEVRAVLDVAFATIEDAVRRDSRFAWLGFGVFYLKTRKPRRLRNPQTHKMMKVPGTSKLGFRAGATIVRRR